MAQVQTTQHSSAAKSGYIPGVCNIGPAERAKRRRSGIIDALAAIVLLVFLHAIGTPKDWRLLLILPASASAAGFLQDLLHFCAGFGMRGLYNVANNAGITNNVTSEEFRRKDRNKAQTIIILSLAIGIVAAGLSLI